MRVLVVAPHPDDELLGCGGTLLNLAADGATLGWLIITEITEEGGWDKDSVARRQAEIAAVQVGLSISKKHRYQLKLPPARLDVIPMEDLVKRISDVICDFQPSQIFLPHSRDAHSDHRICFDAVMACTKWFRYPSIRRVLSYETLSETDAAASDALSFQPTVFVNISDFLEKKCELLRVYESEMGRFPFPRSEEAVEALARFRGSQSGFHAAEAFALIRERVDRLIID